MLSTVQRRNSVSLTKLLNVRTFFPGGDDEEKKKDAQKIYDSLVAYTRNDSKELKKIIDNPYSISGKELNYALTIEITKIYKVNDAIEGIVHLGEEVVKIIGLGKLLGEKTQLKPGFNENREVIDAIKHYQKELNIIYLNNYDNTDKTKSSKN